jgi:hypothetical protein
MINIHPTGVAAVSEHHLLQDEYSANKAVPSNDIWA